MAFKIADGYVEVHGRLDDPSFRRAAEEAGERAGRRAGDRFTTAFGRSSTRHRGRLGSIFRQLLTPDPNLMRSLMHPLEHVLSVPIIAAIAAGIVGVGVGAIAAAISSVVLLGVGAAVLGGAAALLADKLEKPFKNAMGRIQKVLTRAAQPLLGPFKTALADITTLVEDLEPQFKELFQAAAPIVPLLVDVFASFAKEILPSITKMMPSIVELFGVLADRSPEIAEAISALLLVMSDEETIEAFGYLLTGLVGTINFVKDALGVLTRAFNNDVEDIKEAGERAGRAIDSIKAALGRIPTKKITKYLFQPGAALSWIGRVTGATRAIPTVWRTIMRFLGGGGAIGWAIRVTGATRNIPKSWKTAYRFLVGGAIGAIKSVIGWLARIPRNVTTTVTSITRNITESITRFINPFARASGGLIGAQGMNTGGVVGSRSVLVGEHGPELAELPFGSRVIPAGQTRTALDNAGGSRDAVVLEINSGGSRLEDLLVELLRKAIRSRGGDVQVALGS